MTEAMGEEGGTMILLSDGRSYPIDEMDKLKQLVEKHWALLNSVDPDKKTRGYEMINEEGKECIWHVKDDSSRVADELSALWSRLTEFARSINLESLDDDEDDGGMEHKLYNQIVVYRKNGTIPYDNYVGDNYGVQATSWKNRCSPYSLADDRMTLKKSGAVVLKKGEVMQVLNRFHQICGHGRASEKYSLLQSRIFFKKMHKLYYYLIASCSCGYNNEEDIKDFRVCIRNISDKRREIVFSHSNLGRKDGVNSDLPIKTPEVKIIHGITESAYQKELVRVRFLGRSSESSKYEIANDGRTLLTISGAVVLKDNEALNLCLRIHELCGHPPMNDLEKILPGVIFIPRLQYLCQAVVSKCVFCRNKHNSIKINGFSGRSPVKFQNVKLDINVHYDDGAVERRFEIITHGVDSKVVDNYVKNTIDTLKKHGKWKEPVFSPEASLARSVLHIVDRLRGNEMKEIESVIEFDPIHNDTVSMEKEQENDMMNEWETESEMGTIVESLVDGESGGEEEDDEEEENIEDEESDVEDEELLQMRRALIESEKEAEHMEKEASRMADATGRMLAYQRQWEFSDFLHEQIEKEENPQKGAVLEESEEEMKDESEEEEEEKIEEVKESDKENDSAGDEAPGTSNVGLSKEEKKRLANKKKRDNKKKKRKGALEKPPYDLLPYRANYEETNAQYPDATNTVQMERVERERKEMEPVISCPVPLTRNEHPERKRGRLAQMRREKEILEKNTKKEEEKKVLPVYNPYAVHFNGDMWPEEQMEKIRKNREERERRKEAGLTESEEEEEEDNE